MADGSTMLETSTDWPVQWSSIFKMLQSSCRLHLSMCHAYVGNRAGMLAQAAQAPATTGVVEVLPGADVQVAVESPHQITTSWLSS